MIRKKGNGGIHEVKLEIETLLGIKRERETEREWGKQSRLGRQTDRQADRQISVYSEAERERERGRGKDRGRGREGRDI